MDSVGIVLRTTKVGDRYVLEDLNEHGLSLGGEQSGHIVMPDYGTTGDGTLTGLALMSRMAETGLSLKTLAEVMHVLPQVLINVPVSDKSVIATHPEVVAAMEVVEDEASFLFDGVPIVKFRHEGKDYEAQMSKHATMAFVSWIESAPNTRLDKMSPSEARRRMRHI